MAGRTLLNVNGFGEAVSSGETAVMTAQIVDDSSPPNPIPASGLNSLVLTIVDVATRAVINGVSNVNILNAGRGTVDSQGNLTVNLTTGDTTLPAGKPRALYALVFSYSWNGGAKSARCEIDFPVVVLSA